MPKLRTAQTAATLLGALLAAGCSGEARTAGDAAGSSPTPQASSAAPSSPTPSASSTTSSPAGDSSNCLFTDTQVSRVLGGTWKRDPLAPGDPCEYTSDGAAGFVTYAIDEPIKLGLRVGRRSCLAGTKPIELPGGAFVCVERNGSDHYILGNTGARGRLWLFVMDPESERPRRAELSAMVSLVRAAPK